MAAVATHLADTSALARLRHPAVFTALAPLVEAGLVATCAVIDFELAWAARTATEYDDILADRALGYELLTIEHRDWARASEVQTRLWHTGHMRAVGFPDLLIAAVAERERVTLLHYDSDFEMVAEITGQAAAWIVPRGSVP